MGKQIQFELWQECNSLCKFCYLGKQNRYTPNELKINAINNAYNYISNLSIYPEYDTIGYLGGEFFQGQLKDKEVKKKFFKLMEKTAQLINAEKIKKVWIYATLTIGDQQDLYNTLKLFKNCKGQIWILTSYDTYGRFHTINMEQNWKYHMKNIHKLYPNIHFNITTILTDDCITKYLNNQISFKNMMEQFNASFFFKQCGLFSYIADTKHSYKEEKDILIKQLPGFLPSRSKFIKFLKKFRLEQSEDLWNKLFNIYYRADVLFRNFNNENDQMCLNIRHKNNKQEIESKNKFETLTNKCGHLMSYATYSDCDKCVLCDKKLIQDIYK